MAQKVPLHKVLVNQIHGYKLTHPGIAHNKTRLTEPLFQNSLPLKAAEVAAEAEVVEAEVVEAEVVEEEVE